MEKIKCHYQIEEQWDILDGYSLPVDAVKPPVELSEGSKLRMNIHQYITERVTELKIEQSLSNGEIIEIISKECLKNEEWGRPYEHLCETTGKTLKDVYVGFISEKIEKVKKQEKTRSNDGDER